MAPNARVTLPLSLLAGLLLWALLPACDPGKPPEPVGAPEIPRVLQEAFKEAKAPTKDAVKQVVTAVEQKQWPQASVAIQHLSGQAGLTAAQKDAVARCLIGINQQVSEAAAAGDQQAEQVQQMRRLDK